jgi:hypothetical protein
VCMRACVCVCLYTCACTLICVHMYVCLCVYLCMCTQHVYTYVYVCTCSCPSCTLRNELHWRSLRPHAECSTESSTVHNKYTPPRIAADSAGSPVLGSALQGFLEVGGSPKCSLLTTECHGSPTYWKLPCRGRSPGQAQAAGPPVDTACHLCVALHSI